MEFRNNFNILSGISTLVTKSRNNKTYLSIELLQKKTIDAQRNRNVHFLPLTVNLTNA